MPHVPYTIRRGGVYHSNVRVPDDLRKQLDTEFIRRSLKTSDAAKARAAASFDYLQAQTRFESERTKLRRSQQPLRTISTLSKREAHDMVMRWFIELESQSQNWWLSEGRNLEEGKVREVVDTLRGDISALSEGGEERAYEFDNGTHGLNAFLQRERLGMSKDAEEYRYLADLFRRAELEHLKRSLLLMDAGPVANPDTFFSDVHAHTSPPRQQLTLAQLLKRYRQWLKDANRTPGTQRTYEIVFELLRSVFGDSKLVSSIDRAELQELVQLLRRVPRNWKTRYPTRSIIDAITEADRRNDNGRLGSKTLKNYYRNLLALFNFAVEEGVIRDNPLRGRLMRAAFEIEEEEKEKPLFSIDQLNRMFAEAPLYKGCVDDELGYSKAGTSHPRRGRFWLPLIALFHGFRSTEIGQLNTEDIKEDDDGILYFFIRRLEDDNASGEKRTKNVGAKRKVPVHPELLRIGFGQFVTERRLDTLSRRLFPELPRGNTGYVSNAFGKWFGRFVDHTLEGEGCRATFHSFRHMFRDALRAADVSVQYAEALGGWSTGTRSAEKLYGRGPTLSRLREEIAKVQYPGLHLEHLYLS